MHNKDSEVSIKLLKEKGLRITKGRGQIVNYILEKQGVFSARELLKKFSKVDPASVYRTLTLLEDLDIIDPVTKIKDFQYYEVHERENKHHHHLVCKDCGDAKCIDCPFEESKANFKDYAEVHHSFVLTGFCKNCA